MYGKLFPIIALDTSSSELCTYKDHSGTFLFNVFSPRLLLFNSRIVLRRRHGVAFSMSSTLCATPLTKPPRLLITEALPPRENTVHAIDCVMVPGSLPLSKVKCSFPISISDNLAQPGYVKKGRPVYREDRR